MAYFPFMIQVEDKKCLIAGGGRVALRKVEMMLAFGGQVKVVAPKICNQLLELEEKEEHLVIEKRTIQKEDICDRDIVIMATNDNKVNKEFATLCKQKRILVNVVDVKEDCSFYFPAIIRQDDVVIGVSTGGNSPLLASQIKKDIMSNLRTDYGQIAKDMGRVRQDMIQSEKEEVIRKEKFTKMLEEKLEENIIRIGTRGSKLALIQTEMVIEQLKKAYPKYQYKKVILTTKGDKKKHVSITSFGGKAVFVEEIEQALEDGIIDIAVHSAKDMPNPCKEGLTIAGTLKRACVQDVLIYPKGRVLKKEDAFIVGTGSLRRQWQLKMLYPKAECKDLRGNVGTRIEKLRNGQYDAIILAAAGLQRQGLMQENDLEYYYFSTDEMLPAAGQAIIAMETKNDTVAKRLVQNITDSQSQRDLMVERAVLSRMDAGCHEPIGVLAQGQNGSLTIQLMTVQENRVVRKKVQGSEKDQAVLIDKLCEK